jgi:hypothetical protein
MRRVCLALALLAAGCGGGSSGPRDTGNTLQTSKNTYAVGTPAGGARSFLDALRYKDEQALRTLSTGPTLEVVDASGADEVKSRLGPAINDMQREIGWEARGSSSRAKVIARGYILHVRLHAGMWKVASITRGSEQVLP